MSTTAADVSKSGRRVVILAGRGSLGFTTSSSRLRRGKIALTVLSDKVRESV
jgi:hypothetical protein